MSACSTLVFLSPWIRWWMIGTLVVSMLQFTFGVSKCYQILITIAFDTLSTSDFGAEVFGSWLREYVMEMYLFGNKHRINGRKNMFQILVG